MASPMLESRVEPHKKAHFSLHISDQIAQGGDVAESFSSVKYNHKPPQTSETRTTTLTSSSATAYNLRVQDTNSSGDKDIFTFTGQKTALKKSYVLVFDASNQQATLEPLSSSYTFNLASKNGNDVSSQHTKIYPKKVKDTSQDKDDDDADLFGEAAVEDEGADPDPDNPYDFRHFLSKEKEKHGNESEYQYASSPDYRTGTGSALNTPQPPSSAPARKAVAPVPKKRKTANPMLSRPKKTQPPPAVRLERTATDPSPKPKSKTAAVAPPPSKIKSSEIVHSSDESDGEVASSPAHRSPSPERRQQYRDQDEDAEGESDDGGLEIDVPDAHPPRRNNPALASHLGHNINAAYTRSPSNGPISLASAANSDGEDSPNPRHNRNTQDEIDFGDLGGDDAEGEDDDEDEDDYNNRDIEPMDIGPPARQDSNAHDRKASVAAVEAVDDDEDDLEELMRRGLEGGDSSEESEEE